MKAAIFLAASLALAFSSHAQKISRVDRDLAEGMLDRVSSDVHENYYDPKMHGLDWDALVHEAKKNIDKAPDLAHANAQIAGLLERLNDSHTRYFPPRYQGKVDYGWKFQMIGSRAYVTEVSPDSDAQSKGVHAGDQLLTIDGFTVDRASVPGLTYAMNAVLPRDSLEVDLLDPTQKVLHLTLNAKVKRIPPMVGLGDYSWYLNQQRIDLEGEFYKQRIRYVGFGSQLMILQLPSFELSDVGVGQLYTKARAYKTLIVDLRGNPGGSIDSLKSFLANLFNREVPLGQWVERSKNTAVVVKGNRAHAFTGDLMVLVDSKTASAGEIFARIVQIEQRGTVLGDHTSGRTMESRMFPHELGEQHVYYFGESVTVADAIMPDGKSLEHVGVQPDRIFLPTPADLAAGTDPVLAYAAGLAGVNLTPEAAAKLFPPDPPSE